MLVAGASTRQEARGRVVGLRGRWEDDGDDSFYMPLSISVEGLNMLFTQWKSILHLHELHLDLPVPCDGIPWPDLSGLRVLTLGISGEKNQRLKALLCHDHLSLESLDITTCTFDDVLAFEDCFAIGIHIKFTTFLKTLCVEVSNDLTDIDDKGMEVISEALAHNQLLPLERLELKCKGTFTDTAADCLAQFITNTTTLQHLTIGWFRFSAPVLLALAQAIHCKSTLQEKSLGGLTVTVNGDNEAKDFDKLLVEYSYMVCYLGKISLQCNNISDAGLAKVLHHNSSVKRLDLSNNNISDVGAVALAQALHYNSTLERLNLSGNDAIGKEGTHQLVQALTVNISITTSHGSGLILPRRCEEYATQCTQYNTVKNKIAFR